MCACVQTLPWVSCSHETYDEATGYVNPLDPVICRRGIEIAEQATREATMALRKFLRHIRLRANNYAYEYAMQFDIDDMVADDRRIPQPDQGPYVRLVA